MWPTPQDYNEAIQNPELCFRDAELTNSLAVLNTLGLPKPVSDAFASVYQMTDERGKQFAVRCFLRDVPDQAARYEAISAKFKEAALPYMVPFELIAEGIKINGSWFPILKMEWISGLSLIDWLLRNLDDSDTVRSTANAFASMLVDLRIHGIAHGDLQHGNIIITNEGKLRLVDYDGMFVPALNRYCANRFRDWQVLLQTGRFQQCARKHNV